MPKGDLAGEIDADDVSGLSAVLLDGGTESWDDAERSIVRDRIGICFSSLSCARACEFLARRAAAAALSR